MIELLYIDLFCGAGGTSTGVAKARLHGRKCAKVIACVNHDANAIASHQANHPDTLHFTEDIRTLELGPLVKHLDKMKKKYPNARTAIWASLECTNFSKAKGGQPRDADSRTLAEHLFRYIEALHTNYIIIENVEEFMCWGDLDENGKPVSKDQSLERPAGTLTCIDHHAFVTAYFGNGYNSSIEEPNPTVTTKERHALVNAVTVKDHNIDLDQPMPDCIPLDKVEVLTKQFLANEYSGGGQLGSLETVNPAVLCTPKQKIVTAEQYLMNPQYQSDGGSIDNPCFTLIARMDKMPPYLISTEQGELAIAITKDDTLMTRKIKEFMAMYGIIDIKMRMLNIQELKRIMGFPEDYTLIGTQAEQKKFIGNAVEVNMSRVLCEALCSKLETLK